MPSATRLGVAVCFAVAAAAQPAAAFKEFQKVFVNEYAKGPDVDRDFARSVKKAKCYLCHQGKEDRKNCNVYGVALTPHVGEDDKKDKEKIIAALRAVAAEPVDPADPSGPTFGDRITGGELPGGPLEESKKEPPASPTAANDPSRPAPAAG